jgi:hypothetical protein
MSTAEVTRADGPREEDGASRSHEPPSSPGLAAAWLLRAAAFAAVAAGISGVILAPGVRGNASEAVVNAADRAAAVLGYFLVSLLVALVLWGAFELAKVRGLGVPPRVALIASGMVGVACGLVGLSLGHQGQRQQFEDCAVVLCAVAAVGAIAGAYASSRAPHTRAAAGMLLAFAFAAISRLGAFELATAAGERASMQLYGFSRGLATAGVLFESFGQFLAVTWLFTRSRLWGQLGAAAALFGAIAVTWGVAKGLHSGASLWEAVLHTALGDAAGVPLPYWLEKVAVFLVPASLLLALVAASQPRQVVAVTATVSLALVSRGAFDAPLRALCAIAAAQWAALAGADDRAMWRTLIEDRKRRLEEEGFESERGERGEPGEPGKPGKPGSGSEHAPPPEA